MNKEIPGIDKKEAEIIHNILIPYLKNFDFYYYGSRVRGDFRKLSDLDILIKGQKPFNSADLADLKNAFDNSTLPFIVNLADFQNISEKFYNSIQEDLVKICP